ncbi:AraC family transcriptional regulator [Microbacterium sp. SORGH_AS_0888]|uniref:AraC family transcriptional regulator n=1 Tax=Microbacterium sp. SORGH_AS_0888 TaxID=3041791 RepID=UPI0027D77759|nr:AraC family transcriptional regulator [Microbacterium sp. SORGH_AS_0888]
MLATRQGVRAGDVDEANDLIANLFCAHTLVPLEQGVQLTLRSAHAGPVGLELLNYGEGVRISPVGLGEFHLVQIPLRGRARMRVGGTVVESSPQRATVPPIDRDFVMEWKDDTPHLIVYVDREELLRVASVMWSIEDPSRLRLAPGLELGTPAGQAFLRSVLELHDVLDAPNAPNGELSRKLAAELMVSRLLLAVDSSVARSLESWQAPATSHSSDQTYRRFVAAAEQSPIEDLTPLEIARMLGMPLRTLQEHVHRASGSTPSVLLREMRFRRAHERLRGSDPSRTTVTAIAEACGFGHLGRFAGEYKLRFGESPAETLRR